MYIILSHSATAVGRIFKGDSMKKNIILLVLLLIAIASILILRPFDKTSQQSEVSISNTGFLMGTVIDIKLFNTADQAILNGAFDIIRDIENKMSLNIAGSEINKLNESSGITPVAVSNETYEVVKKGLKYSSISHGSFDITIGPLVKLWGIGTDNARVPSQQEIEDAKGLVGYSMISTDDSSKSVYLQKPGMSLDLGGVAKGYAADEIAEYLKAHGVSRAIINLGGNVMAVGSKDAGTPWKIGVQNPFDSRGSYIGTVAVSDSTVVTSGIYERYFESESKLYHHILSPFTGYPVDNGLSSVTIIAKSSADADALSTSVFSLGLEKGMELAESLEDVEAIAIDMDRNIYLTSGAKEIFSLTDKTFNISSTNN